MPNLIKKISLQWDLWIGQFRAFFPTDKEDIRACHKVLGNENSALKIPSQLAACQDTHSGEVIACMRLVNALDVKKAFKKEETSYMDFFGEERLKEMAFFNSISIAPAYLKTSAPQILISHCFIEILKAGGQAVLMSCDPGHFSIYKRIGLRPLAALQKTSNGDLEIPMIFIPDQEYLSIIHSPVLPMLRGIQFDNYKPLVQWYHQMVRENEEMPISSAFYTQEEEFGGHDNITRGLSEDGKNSFLSNAMKVICKKDEVLITENDAGKSFGYVSKGVVKVMIGNRTIVLLGEGDIFGEIAFILGSKRTAQVVAASDDTEVVLFSESAISRLNNEADKTMIWRNLAKILAQRVILTNRLLDSSE
jgi:CRP-like cAMP-binding protein